MSGDATPVALKELESITLKPDSGCKVYESTRWKLDTPKFTPTCQIKQYYYLLSINNVIVLLPT